MPREINKRERVYKMYESMNSLQQCAYRLYYLVRSVFVVILQHFIIYTNIWNLFSFIKLNIFLEIISMCLMFSQYDSSTLYEWTVLYFLKGVSCLHLKVCVFENLSCCHIYSSNEILECGLKSGRWCSTGIWRMTLFWMVEK